MKKVKVAVYNDDVTPYNAVVQFFTQIFDMPEDDADAMTSLLDQQPKDVPLVLGEYIPEIAESLVQECNNANEMNDLTLRIEILKD